ncbi:hypothetical protein COS91_04875 [Candidatus Desantisbacteria bacterium CG07_land_8_20_14_0_80_39_15]|uniref:Response regulatory domain-containing protein n=1 Tax=Candidatus Desantisbacteria bacterium CG07_land_8_20_14_0_80_39_15 TaxID=1974549 RepID=A0A2M6ZG80_9BACT|nr:MAG: hypothetical protein COS91_04875 [Candidatus Desantisbacteria bacterium CG07_land_8_20_14_0_80_39_15]
MANHPILRGGGDLLPVLNVVSSNGEIETYPCRSYTPIKIGKDPILIVDDDEEVCRTLQKLLKLEGYEQIHTATSGKEALARIKVMKYDLIFLDVRMPEMNGVEILKEIRKYDEKVPVAIMSAYDFIKKPFDFDYLKASVLSKLIPSHPTKN